MRYTIKFGTYFGIPVRIHITFPLILIVFGIEAWVHGSWRDAVWAVLLITAVFVCVVLHEFGHSLQVRRYGILVKDIVLLPIGGMARAESIPDKPWQEIVVAVSGPMVNFFLAAIFLGILLLRRAPVDFESDFIANLFAINIVLGTFNLTPAFPMDGGRMLRGILATRMSYLRATRYARNVGQVIAILFVVVAFLDNRFILLPLIAVFIYFGAISEERLVRVKYSLKGKTVGDFLASNLPVLQADVTLENAEPIFQASNAPALAVIDETGMIAGAVLREDFRRALNERGGDMPLRSILRSGFPLLRAETPAMQAYLFLRSGKHAFAGVIQQGAYVGLILFEDIARSAAQAEA